MVATYVPAAASRTTTMTARGKRAVVLLPRRLRPPCRFGLSGQATASLRVAIGVCVVGHLQLASDNSVVSPSELCVTAKTLRFTIVVMSSSLYGSTSYNVTMPASTWFPMWKWNI
jgi:hypothetical protein